MKMSYVLAVLICCCSLIAVEARAQSDDYEGCKDSPLITRFPGSSIHGCENKEFDQVELAVSKDKDGEPVMKTLEGEYHSWDYGTREGVSEIQVFRNFQTALKTAGFAIDYEDSPRTITAHKGNTWYRLENSGSYYYQTLLTIKAMAQEVAVDASSLAQGNRSVRARRDLRHSLRHRPGDDSTRFGTDADPDPQAADRHRGSEAADRRLHGQRRSGRGKPGALRPPGAGGCCLAHEPWRCRRAPGGEGSGRRQSCGRQCH